MRTFNFIFIFLFLFLKINSFGNSPEEVELNCISIDSIKKHIKILGSDSLQGRGTGTIGGDKAAQYIARQLEKLHFERYIPIGETDSEQAFCHILDLLSELESARWTESDFDLVQEHLRDINDGQNTLNCIFSDGSYLFCYSDENDYNNGLRFTRQFAPFGSIELVTPEKRLGNIELRSEITSSLDQHGYLISTRILTSEDWIEFNNGELIVFRDGEIVYPQSHR